MRPSIKDGVCAEVGHKVDKRKRDGQRGFNIDICAFAKYHYLYPVNDRCNGGENEHACGDLPSCGSFLLAERKIIKRSKQRRKDKIVHNYLKESVKQYHWLDHALIIYPEHQTCPGGSDAEQGDDRNRCAVI